MPWPTTNAPGQDSPSRESASSFSSTTVTSQPSLWRLSAMVEPTLPQPMTSAFMRPRVARAERSVAQASSSTPCGKATIRTSAGRLAQDVVDGRREEARLAPPARRRAEDDEVRPALLGRLDDRVADRRARGSVGPRPRRRGRAPSAAASASDAAACSSSSTSSASSGWSSGTLITKTRLDRGRRAPPRA